MKILISPAKSINTDVNIKTPSHTTAIFLKEADLLMSKLSKLSVAQLAKLMHTSDSIAELNHYRNTNWVTPNKPSDITKPAITVFTGEVYKGLDVETFTHEDFLVANKNLRILSGLYGILKPLDLLYPYRLEMGTKWQISAKNKNLYAFWGDKIKKSLMNELDKDEAIINLASTEYFKATQSKTITNRIITPLFKDFKNGDYKVIMMYAKHARGEMARFIIKNKLTNPEDLKSFNVGNYRYDENISTENEWMFTR